MKLKTRLIPSTPYYMFCKQASDAIEAIRSKNQDVAFMPLQFGGLFGQKTILHEQEVMEITEVDGGVRKNVSKVRNMIGG